MQIEVEPESTLNLAEQTKYIDKPSEHMIGKLCFKINSFNLFD